MSNTEDRIRESAADIEIPERISPERIAKTISEQAEATPVNLMRTADELSERKNGVFKKSFAAIAAAIAMFVVLGALFKFGYDRLHPVTDKEWAVTALSDSGEADDETAQDAKEAAADVDDGSETDDYAAIADMLHPAASYDEIEAALMAFNETYVYAEGLDMGTAAETADLARVESAGNASASKEEVSAHSDTNVRTAGVDEADIVKTDGKYIYICRRTAGQIEIILADNGSTSDVTRFTPGYDGRETELSDIYLDGDTLIILGNVYDAELKEEEGTTGEQTYEDVYRVGMKSRTAVWIYSIADRNYPMLVKRLLMDGSYRTSRLIGGENGQLYLFTDHTVGWGYADTYYGSDDTEGGFKLIKSDLPSVDETEVEPDMILIPDELKTRNAFCMAAIDLASEGSVTDYKVILGYTSDIYVSSDAVYLLGSEYQNEMNSTNVVRFAFSGNSKRFIARGAANVPGNVRDAFAIDEKDGVLRVAVTVDRYAEGSLNRTNELHIYDGSMKKLGELKDIAAGEEIKSARYIGDYLYLVTFRNTDPLFAIDLSDPAAPAVVGELKLLGFSEYLHPWGDSALFGLGVDADSDGSRKGLRLSLFDIADPLDIDEITTIKISADDSSTFWDHRAISVYESGSYVGFVTETYGTYKKGRYTGDEVAYNVYEISPEGDVNLVKKIDIAADDSGYVWNVSSIRGVFIDDCLYLITDDGAEGYML